MKSSALSLFPWPFGARADLFSFRGLTEAVEPVTLGFCGFPHAFGHFDV